ncbi:MAG: hypothetical protein ACR2H5_07810 [Ktedonobacteraceae bacterium]
MTVDAEPDTVEQLDRRGPDAAHFAAGVEAQSRITAILATDFVGAITCRGVAAQVKLVRYRERGTQARRTGASNRPRLDCH